MGEAKQMITQETMDAIVDELASKGLAIEEFATPFDDAMSLSEYTEEAGQELLTAIKRAGTEAVYLDADVKEVPETLPVKLSDTDYKDYAIKIGLASQEIAQAEDNLAAMKSQFKARIDAAVAQRNEFASIINAGVIFKTVKCHLVKNYRENSITVIRLDTGEIVRSRTMTVEERQRGLFVPEQTQAQEETQAQ